MAIITLTTDFGTRDHYVGSIKGVLLGMAPKATVVDVTHEVPPQDVMHAAFVLRELWPWYPRGTVHLVVVDPGVGTDRRIILAQYGGSYVVAPDNGVITWLHRSMRAEEMCAVENPRYFLPGVSNTFHGRDIMAPVAAHLASGVKPREFGRSIDRVEVLPMPARAERTAGGLAGRVIYVDRFGTLVTNISEQDLFAGRLPRQDWAVVVNGEEIGPIRRTFSDAPQGSPVALIGSASLLEIAVNRGSALERFGPADQVKVTIR